ncbi:MAG: N-acetylglucosamine-6-phosphate deacetylase [Candidatus Njordarchaeia archaeon]
MSYIEEYKKKVEELVNRILIEERDNIEKAAELLSEAIAKGKVIHVFGTGHSMLIAEEMFLRAGGLAPINAWLDERFSVSKGYSSSAAEKTSGFAEDLIRKYGLEKEDIIIIISVSGVNAVPVEVAVESKNRGAFVIGVTSVNASSKLKPRNKYDKHLYEVADIVIDNKVPYGDACIEIEGIQSKVAPLSSIAGIFIANTLLLHTVKRLVDMGIKPPVWVSGNIPNSEKQNMALVMQYASKISHIGIEGLIQRISKKKEEKEIIKPIETPNEYVLIGHVITPYYELEEGFVHIKGHQIMDVGYPDEMKIPDKAEVLKLDDKIIAPGFIDIHIHGCEGANIFQGTEDSVIDMSRNLVKHGITAFLPTAGPVPYTLLQKTIESVRNATGKVLNGATVLGLNIEGPYVNPEKKGAMIVGYMRKPSLDEIKEIFDTSNGTLKLMTVAPELPGAIDIIKWLSLKGVITSLGHTNATYSEAIRGFNAGARNVTHLYNAMRSFHHRDPGIIGAALEREDVYVELIADLIHVKPSALRMAITNKGYDKVILVSDATPLAGFPDGEYTFPGFPKITIKDGKATLPDGTLAGSTLTLERSIYNLSKRLRIPLKYAIMMASTNPARLLGLSNKGEIKVGNDADLVILNKDLSVFMTITGGKIIYKAT